MCHCDFPVERKRRDSELRLSHVDNTSRSSRLSTTGRQLSSYSSHEMTHSATATIERCELCNPACLAIFGIYPFSREAWVLADI